MKNEINNTKQNQDQEKEQELLLLLSLLLINIYKLDFSAKWIHQSNRKIQWLAFDHP